MTSKECLQRFSLEELQRPCLLLDPVSRLGVLSVIHQAYSVGRIPASTKLENLLRENSNQPRKLLKVRSHISLDNLGIATIQKEGAEMSLRFVEM